MNTIFTKRTAARIYFLLILAIAPLYMTKGFRRILTDKATIVWISIVVGMALFFLLAVKELVIAVKGHSIKEVIKKDREKKNIKKPIDLLVLLFGGVCLVSSLYSEYTYEALTGAGAWYVGGAMLASLAIMYFITSEKREDDIVPFFGMMLGGTITMIIALLNDLWIDPLGALATVDVNWKNHYTSTIGNSNQFCGYLSIVIPIMVIIFITSENGFKKTAAAIVLFFGYLNMFLTHADSIYIGVGIGYIFIIAFCLKKTDRWMGLLINGVLFGVAGFAAKVIILYRPEIKLDTVSPVLLAHNVHLIVGGLCFVLLLLQMALELKFKKEDIEKLMGYMFWLYLILVIVLAICVIVYAVKNYDMNFLNRRGLLWYIAASTFWDNELMQQLIGIGPGCIDEISRDYYFEIVEAYGDFYFLENAHNDVLEYLLTTGIIGALSYLGIYLCVIVDFVKNVIKNTEVRGVRLYAMIGIIGYIAQSIMNGPHPLTTAMFFVLLAIYRSTLDES
ncbi:O-antigen ligase family protein [Butyrivibrio sp. AC2005]|uniref:O-antigen ligase family protein n=1 Tax=Butyrivibrio sp. AC2005 TaxID=1280672 RepID=UPI0004167708|nr:O-antigen ligase family protein [Butyrivibrio sp. AC2005]